MYYMTMQTEMNGRDRTSARARTSYVDRYEFVGRMIDEVAVVQGRDELAWESADAAASAGHRADDKRYRATIRYQISLPRPIDCMTMSGASSAQCARLDRS